MLCRILFQQVLEVWRAGTDDHLVSFGVLTLKYLPRQCVHQRLRTENYPSYAHLSGDGHVAEALLVSEVLEGGYHVGLEVVT